MANDISNYITPGRLVLEEHTVKYTKITVQEPPTLNFSEKAPYTANIQLQLGTEEVSLKSDKNGKIIENNKQYSKDKTTITDVWNLLVKVVKDKWYNKKDEVKIEYSGLDPKVIELANVLKTQYAGLVETYKNGVQAIPTEEKGTVVKKEFQITQNGIVPLGDGIESKL